MVKPQYYYYQNHGGSSGGGGDSSGTDSSWSNYLIDAYAGTAVGLSHFKWFVGKTMDQGLESFLSVLSGGRDNDGETIDNAGASGSSNTNNSDGDNEYANPGMEPSIGDLTSPKDRGLKVVGVGYGRTGTYSLAIALDMLGFPTLVSSTLNALLHLLSLEGLMISPIHLLILFYSPSQLHVSLIQNAAHSTSLRTFRNIRPPHQYHLLQIHRIQ